MHRSVLTREHPASPDVLLPDEAGLLAQLLEHLLYSGFVLDRPTASEREAGEWVLRCFLEQEGQFLRAQIAPERRERFMSYLRQHDPALMRERLHHRIIRSFNQVARGQSHPVILKRRAMQGLGDPKHPLQELLMLLEAYWTLQNGEIPDTSEGAASAFSAFEEMEGPESTESRFTPEDVLRLRREVQERLEGKKFVNVILGAIAAQQGRTVEQLQAEQSSDASLSHEQSAREIPAGTPLQFVRPSQYKPLAGAARVSTSQAGSFSVPLVASAEPSEGALPSENESAAFEAIPEIPAEEISSADELPTDWTLGVEEATLEQPQESPTLDPEPFLEEDEEVEGLSPADQPPTLSDLAAFDEDESDVGEDLEIDNPGTVQVVEDDEADVVFGNGTITSEAMVKFVHQYPDSALKFVFRRDIDGRPLPREHEDVHIMWENRDLKRPKVRRYVLKLLGMEDFPDLPIHELLGELRSKIFEMQHNK
jgi:hypothetical protein